ncbi:MAG: SSI family serine proteinase inhibitor [Actinomycetota bacterium]
MRRLAPSLLVALALLAACGGTDDGAADAGGSTALEIALWPAGEGQGAAVVATLTCDPAGGDLPDPAAACAALVAEADALEPVPSDTACTMLYGGPEEARITGTLDGVEMAVRLSRGDGCQIDRWERLRPLLPAYEPVPL